MSVHGVRVSFESALEADFLEIMNFDRSVTKLREQPVQLRFHDRYSIPHRYTPDFLVVHGARSVAGAGPRVFLYEVKYRADLFALWPSLKPKFLEARRYARERDMEFRIVSEVEIRGPYLDNVRLLNHHREAARRPGMEERLTTVFLEGPPITTARALIERAWNDLQFRKEAEGSLLRLLAVGDIHADLTQPITLDSAIWAQEGVDGGYLWDPYSSRSTQA